MMKVMERTKRMILSFCEVILIFEAGKCVLSVIATQQCSIQSEDKKKRCSVSLLGSNASNNGKMKIYSGNQNMNDKYTKFAIFKMYSKIQTSNKFSYMVYMYGPILNFKVLLFLCYPIF